MLLFLPGTDRRNHVVGGELGITSAMPTFHSQSTVDEGSRSIARLEKAGALVWRRSVC